MILIHGEEVSHETEWGVVLDVNDHVRGVDIADDRTEAESLAMGAGLPLVRREVYVTDWLQVATPSEREMAEAALNALRVNLQRRAD